MITTILAEAQPTSWPDAAVAIAIIVAGTICSSLFIHGIFK